MQFKSALTVVTYGLLGMTVLGAVLAPDMVTVPAPLSSGADDPDLIELRGVARDFHRSHADFQVTPAAGFGPYAGLVQTVLGTDGRPVFRGDGLKVLEPARNASGQIIAPHLAAGSLENGLDGVRVLLVVRNGDEPGANDLARRDLLRSWGHEVQMIDDHASPARWDESLAGADVLYVCDDVDPLPLEGLVRSVPLGVVVENAHLGGPATGIAYSVVPKVARSIVILDANHPITAGLPLSELVLSGEPVAMHHTYGGMAPGGQALARVQETARPSLLAIETGQPLLDEAPTSLDETPTPTPAPARRVRLPWGNVRPGDEGEEPDGEGTAGQVVVPAPPFDFAALNGDALMLLSRSIDWAARGNPRGLVCSGRKRGDQEAELDVTPCNGGVLSSATFSQWFRDVPGVNQSVASPLVLRRGAGDVFVFDDTLDPFYRQRQGFFPVDGGSFDHEGNTANNHHFTYQFDAMFVHDPDLEPFLRVTSGADVWVFIADLLAIDLAGYHPLMGQRVDLDRLCLEEGQAYRFSFFLAQRYAAPLRLRIETNLPLFQVTEIQSAGSGPVSSSETSDAPRDPL